MQDAHSAPEQVRALINGFLRRTGMAPADFARRIGYHYTTLNQFMRGAYRRGPGSKEAAIMDAVLRCLAEQRQDGPEEFHGKLYEIGNTRAMRDALRQLCENPCILLVYAPPGSGKTDVARALIPEYRTPAVQIHRIYCRSGVRPRDLMRRIAIACGSVADLSIERTIHNLRYDHNGRRVVLYFDEAQHLDVPCLETVREFYDEMRWSLCFAGSHSLDRIFSKWAGELEQLERRVTGKVILPSLTIEEAEGIFRSELPSLKVAKVRALIDRSHVEIRADGRTHRYLSIGRVMANICELQKLLPEAGDDRECEEPEDANA